MSHDTVITDTIEFFFFNTLESYRSLEKATKDATSFKSIFKQKDFLDLILQLKELKAEASSLLLSMDAVKGRTQEELRLQDQINLCLGIFQKLLDHKIAANKCLERKTRGDKSGKKEYRDHYLQAEKTKKELNLEILKLDDMYTPYMDE